MNQVATQSPEAKEISPFSALVKQWRQFRKYSQLDLSLDAGISQRHISFLESGRSRPSRDMVVCLAEALDMPLRDRNQLLTSAGFAPLYKERSLDNDEMKSVQHALELTLKHHEPFPAIVVDSNWNLRMANAPADNLIGLLGEPEEVWQKVDPSGDHNVYRLTIHPDGMRPLIGNWEHLAKMLILRLQRESNADPNNAYLENLLEEMIELSGIDLGNSMFDICMPLAPVLPMEIHTGDFTLKNFSMISTFGTALDVTADELKVETFFPADDFTRDFFVSQHRAKS